MALDATVGNARRRSEELVLHGAVVASDDGLLVVVQSKKGLLLLDAEALVLLHTLSHLSLDHGQESVSSIGHLTLADAIKGRLEAGSLDALGVSGLINEGKNLLGRALSDLVERRLEVGLLE